ncbi:MAG: hypothetical protein P8X66_12800 [Maritimibacter sp.]
MSLLDAGIEALKASSDPHSKAAVRDSIASLNVVTIGGTVDFTSGPVPNVAHGPILGSQWVKATEGPFELDYVLVNNATDPNVPITAKLIPYNE